MRAKAHPYIHAQQRSDHPAYVMASTGETVTYGQIEERSNQGAHLFRRWGLTAGDSVAIFAENHPRFLELCWAAQRSGLYYSPMSWRLTVPEVEYIVSDSGSKVLFLSSRFASMAEPIAAAVGDHVRIVSIGDAISGCDNYESLRDALPTSRIPDESAGSDMLYTSGTTGKPKGVRVPLTGAPIDEIAESQWLYYERGFDEHAILLAPGPLYHAAPLRASMATMLFGGTCVVVDHFDAEMSLELIERYKVTHTDWVPTHFVRLLALPAELRRSYDVSSVEAVIHGAAPCPIHVKEQIIDWFGPIVVEYYGGTEGVGACLISSSEWLQHKGSVGRPVHGIPHVLDEATWTEVAPGADGAIYFESDREFSYHNAPEKTALSRSPQGWVTLGDIGHVLDDGYLYLTDRKSNMIISGGVNVYPQEAENRLIAHPAVADVAVIGVPNEEFGEEVKAIVQPRRWDDATPELAKELIKFCREELSPIKCPRSVDFLRELPRYENGKLYKRLLRDSYWGIENTGLVPR